MILTPARYRELADRLAAGWGYNKRVTPSDIYDAITALRALAEEGENTDMTDEALTTRAREAEGALAQASFLLDAVADALDGLEVSDFAESFGIVRSVLDIKARADALQQQLDEMRAMFDARPQMGRENFRNLSLPDCVRRLFEIRDGVGLLCSDLAEQIAPETVRGIELANGRAEAAEAQLSSEQARVRALGDQLQAANYDFMDALRAERERITQLEEALREIADPPGSANGICECDHGDDCCAKVNYHCPQCIAARALLSPDDGRQS
jgi:hypothetical protein